MDGLLPHTISSSNFGKYLRLYNDHIRDVYQHLERQRFVEIPTKLTQRMPPYLTKNEVLDMDKWMQKRGTPLTQAAHNHNTKRIQSNADSAIEEHCKKAFEDYSAKGPVSAMQELQKLKGIGHSRASLLLSVAYPDDIPYLSRQLYRWIHWDEKSGWGQECSLKDRGQILLQEVAALRERFSRDFDQIVTAVDLEKLAFVLERESAYHHLRKENISRPEGNMVATGSYGYLYEVKETDQVNGAVAVKRVLKVPSLRRHRFLSEVEAASMLSQISPEHFVRFIGWNEDDDNLYLSMEYMDQGDLEKRLSAGNFSKQEAKDVTRQILGGLIVMHREGFAHRDLKPQNILIASKASDPIKIKITDFGVSKRLSDRKTSMLRTTTGTALYRAPEVLLRWNHENENGDSEFSYNEKVDLWSLGCVIYRMIQGKTLFSFENDIPVNQRQPRIQKMKKKLDGMGLGTLGNQFVKNLLQVNAEKRPSAKEALDRLEW